MIINDMTGRPPKPARSVYQHDLGKDCPLAKAVYALQHGHYILVRDQPPDVVRIRNCANAAGKRVGFNVSVYRAANGTVIIVRKDQ